MCHCGDHYCDMDRKTNRRANAMHDRLFKSESWIRRYPDPVARDVALAVYIRDRIARRFGPRAYG